MAFIGRGINTIRTIDNQTKTGRIDFADAYHIIFNKTTASGNKDVSMVLGNTIDNTGSTVTDLATRKVVNGKELYSVIRTYITANGIVGTSCPGSTANDSILTTQSCGSNYVRFGNGLILQWGLYQDGDSATVTVNFPTAFSNTNYQVAFGRQGGAMDAYAAIATSKSTTGMNVWRRNSGSYQSGQTNWIAIGY